MIHALVNSELLCTSMLATTSSLRVPRLLATYTTGCHHDVAPQQFALRLEMHRLYYDEYDYPEYTVDMHKLHRN